MSKILVDKFYSYKNYVGSSDEIIEIDESKIGKRKYNKGYPINGVWIIGLVKRGEKEKTSLFQVDDRTKCTLQIKIKNLVKKGATIYSDC